MTAVTAERDYVREVAGEVRAMAARREITSKEIAHYLGTTEMSVSRRMRGAVPWTAAELLTISRLLRCRPVDLLPHLDSNQEPFDYRSRHFASFMLAA